MSGVYDANTCLLWYILLIAAHDKARESFVLVLWLGVFVVIGGSGVLVKKTQNVIFRLYITGLRKYTESGCWEDQNHERFF